MYLAKPPSTFHSRDSIPPNTYSRTTHEALTAGLRSESFGAKHTPIA